MIKDPVKLISYSTVFMKYWVGLHGEKDAEDLRLGADGLLKLATTPTVAGRTRSNEACLGRFKDLCRLERRLLLLLKMKIWSRRNMMTLLDAGR
jgi:hypothetical protein